MTKPAGNCGFGHIYWRNSQWKTSFFVQWIELSKIRPIPEDTWYHWLITYIPKSMKKSESNAKQNAMKIFESKIDNNTSSNYKPGKLQIPLKADMLNTRVRRIKKLSIKGYFEKIRPHLRVWAMILNNLVKGKCIWQWNLNLFHQKKVLKNGRCILRVIAA